MDFDALFDTAMSNDPAANLPVSGCDFDRFASTITPETAKQLLSLNAEYNRPLREVHVKNLATAMSTGNFLDSGATLSIDTEGVVIDGQHRLHACILSQKTFRAVVITGLAPCAYTVTDKGAKRTFGDTLKYYDFINVNRVAALAKITYSWDKGIRSGELMRPHVVEQDLIGYALENREELQTVASGPVLFPNTIAGRIGDLVILLTQRVDVEDSYVFSETLRTGMTDTPGLVNLREALVQDRLARTSKGDYWKLGVILRTWNKWREGELPTQRAVQFHPGGSKANKLPMDLM